MRYGDGTDGRIPVGDVAALAPEGLEPGARVVACWNDGARMFPGSVKELGEGEVVVKWDDGSRPTRVPLDRVAREPVADAPPADTAAAYPVGTPVAARWTDHWYLATIIDFGAGLHHVLYWDSSPGKVTSAQLKPLARRAELVVGGRVLASWNKQAKLDAGTIVELTEAGAVVRWDDGTPASEVAAERIALG
jgi:hypothetical protein